MLVIVHSKADSGMFKQRGWFSGRIVPCHGTDPGSIPGSRTPFYPILTCTQTDPTTAELTVGFAVTAQPSEQLPVDDYVCQPQPCPTCFATRS